jgi:GH15 family glucan-1,4-alpha-glucosidase
VTETFAALATTADSAIGSSRPIASYGLLSDCNTAALVGSDGSIDWFCLPRFDGPAVFARLLDPDAGHWSIRPAGEFSSERRYLPNSLVLETTFTTTRGTVRLLDALAFADGQRGHDLGLDAPRELLRSVAGVSGTVDLVMDLAPRPEYGLVRPLFRQTEGGGRTFGGPNQICVRAGAPTEIDRSTMRAAFTVTEGDEIGFSLRWSPVESSGREPTAPDAVAARIADTAEGWRSWEAAHDIYEGPHRELVLLSSRVLKALTYQPTGAIIAAPTTSLPETVGGERNWDYRYAWIRDASLTLQALYVGTCPDEVENFVSFMTSSAGGCAGADSSLQIMYGIGGEHDLTERSLPHLRGWRDSAPVRVGNGAWSQTQLDVYGELLGAIHLYHVQLGELHPEIQRFVAELADAAASRWEGKDQGMWEMRGDPRHHLSSKVLCWTALDRAVKLAPMLGEHAKVEDWTAERDRIREAILTRGWSDAKQAYAQSFDSDELDAAQLLMPLVGFLPATDERMRSTIEAIANELTQGGLVLRYLSDQGLNADGLTGEEGTFTICSFWLVSALAKAGELERADALFDKLSGYANDLGLLAEEIDVTSGEQLGNFPQAFSHIGLITAAWEIDKARVRAEKSA